MNLLKRIIVSIIFIPLFLWVYYIGGVYLIGLLGLLTVLSSYEIIKMYERKGIKLLYFNAVSSFLFFYCIVCSSTHALYILFLILLFNGIKSVFWGNIKDSTQMISGAIFTVVYPAIGFGLFYRLSDFHQTLIPLLAVLIWMTDSFAYLIGMSFGKHRGIFSCSPKKSIEGFIAGIVFAFVGAFVVKFVFPEVYTAKYMILLGISAGIFGQFGDLFESVIKRDMGAKDSSGLIPGHGGVLDRFDSILIAAPALFILWSLF